jgi:hypothetical protein
MKRDQIREDVRFLLLFIGDRHWARNPIPGLSPMDYGTGSYGGDMEVHRRLSEIEGRYRDKSKVNI